VNRSIDERQLGEIAPSADEKRDRRMEKKMPWGVSRGKKTLQKSVILPRTMELNPFPWEKLGSCANYTQTREGEPWELKRGRGGVGVKVKFTICRCEESRKGNSRRIEIVVGAETREEERLQRGGEIDDSKS